MGYNTFIRIACLLPSNTDLDTLSDWIQNNLADGYPLITTLESMKNYDMQENMTMLTTAFPNLVFGLFYTGDSDELQYFISHAGKNTDEVTIVSDIPDRDDDDEYSNQTVGSLHDNALVERIRQLKMSDISHLFEPK